MTYNKNTWNPYNSSMTYDQNKTNGGVVDSAKLNNMETGISNAFDKTSDTIGGRNLVKDSEQEFTGNAYDFHDYHLASITELTPGKTYTVSFITKVDDKAVKCNQSLFVDISNSSWKFELRVNTPISTDYQQCTNTFMVPEGQTGVAIISVYLTHPNGKSDSSADKSADAGTGYIKEFKLEQGSIATDWTPAPEDKQDKIGYTPADDSKVVHSTVTQLNSTDMNTVLTAGFYRLASGTNGMPNIDEWALYQVINLNNTNGVQLAYGTNNNISGMRSWHIVWIKGNPVITFNSWVQVADDSKVVHSTDTSNWQKQAMFNPGSYVIDGTSSTIDFVTLMKTKYNKPGVVYIRDNTSYVDAVVICEGNGWWHAYGEAGDGNFVHRRIWNSNDTGWVINADDSKVPHLSGANNFDTVPTVNNNPLLLASSLPADLARTGQDEHFTRNITFDNIPRMSNGDPLATASQTGDVNKLLTKDKSSYVNSINELASIVDRFYPVASQVIPTDNISYSNQCLVYNYDPSKNTVTFRKNDASYSINYDTSAVGTNFTENSGGAAPLDGIRIYFGFKSKHYINGSEGTLSNQSYYVWDPNNSGSIKRGRLGLLKGLPYYLTSDNFDVGSNYTIDFSGNGMNLSTSGNNRIAPKLIISNKGNGVLNITPYHGEDFRDDKSEGYWIYPYITKIVSYSVDTTAMKALPNGYSYDYVKDTSARSTGNYLTAWGQGSYQYKFDLNNLGNGYSIDSMGSSITIKVSIKSTDSSIASGTGYIAADGYKSSQFPNGTFTTSSGGYSIGNSYINLSWKLSKEDVVSSSYTAYYQAVMNGNYAVFYAIKLVINNDNTISIYVVNPFESYVYSYTYTTNPSMSSPNAQPLSSTTTISIVNNV